MRYVSDFIVKFYEKSPIWSRNIYSTAYGILKKKKEKNKLSESILKKLLETQWWDKDRLYELQCERLKIIVSHSLKSVPYYRKLFCEYGLSEKSIQVPEDLKILPTLSKDTVRKQFYNLHSDEIDYKLVRREVTSGTTGTPLTLYIDNLTFLYSRAVIKMHRLWAGYTGEQWIGIFTGYRIIPIGKSNAPFWIKNYAGKQIHFSTYHLNKTNIISYYNALSESKIEFLFGYPSSIGLLAKLFNEYLSKSIPLKGVFLGSEPIYTWQRESIKKAFHCNIYDYYGQTENIIMAPGCGYSENLHICLEAGILELNKIDNEKYNLIGTTILNKSMPLIRYELNDITGGYVIEDCKCGRKHNQIKPIETKAEDFIITPTGNYISASILTFPFKTPEGILQSQIIQKEKNLIIVKVVTDEKFTQIEKNKLQFSLKQCVGAEMIIEFEYTDNIPRTLNGKYRFVINELDKSFYL